jgi:hypothetical protein
MKQWIVDSVRFLYWLCLLQVARWLVALFCLAEVLAVLILWPVAFIENHRHGSWRYLSLPIGATLVVAVQVAVWQLTWLRLAERGGKWRALAEWFSRVVRHPVVRLPHSWE